MKKILLTCTDLMAVQFFLEHIEYWAQNDYMVDVVCSPVGGRVDELRNKLSTIQNTTVQTVELSRSPFKLSNYSGYKQMKTHLQKNAYDCIVTNEPVMGLVTRLAVRKKNAQVIYIAHGFHFYKGGSVLKNFIYRTIETIAAHYTDILVTINREDYEASQKFKLRKNGHTEYIPGIGVNFNRFIPVSPEIREAKRKELGILSNELALVTVAELNENKNQKILIDGLAKIDNSNVKLYLIGKGDQRENLENRAKSLGILDRVTFLGYRHDVPQILPAFDIGVSASLREGLPLNLIEEMACGLPVIASVNRGHTDIVTEGCGYLFDPHDVDNFVDTITPLLEQEKLRNDIGKFNIHSCKRFDISKVKYLLLKIINEKI